MSSKLEELAQKEDELFAKLREVRFFIKAEKEKLAEVEHGVKIGSIVVDGRKRVEHRVVSVDVKFGKPWLIGNPRKKDGTFGIAERNLYSDWELVKKEGEQK